MDWIEVRKYGEKTTMGLSKQKVILSFCCMFVWINSCFIEFVKELFGLIGTTHHRLHSFGGREKKSIVKSMCVITQMFVMWVQVCVHKNNE
jgi:hypothetical protein